ncbi:MAG: hypothetical protein A3C10_00290 [Candidatus Magasanikbacteria bacterium RIFCSPHIGHO2_02_FULL_48_18]|nr:MAG: hypothetical protein A3C10_00290 [Candidatus Magasanikbacteria bacterium RIFCSPHIGHO2_02_FULL_48_18]
MIEARGLGCGYDSRFALKDINFKAAENELLGIIGPNGSGKTTLIRAITKIIRPQSGRILLEGEDIDGMEFGELARKMAVVSQGCDTEFDIPVEDYLLLGRIPHRKAFQFLETERDMEIIQRAMDLTDTARFRKRSLNKLSGGERQLVFIARALAQEPRLLLLDEPTNHLDIAHQVKILDLIRRLNRENKITVLIILHDLNLAGEYCDRLMLMDIGGVHKIGRPEEVLTYQNIEQVYKTIVVVEKNPVSAKPYILLVSEEERARKQSKTERSGHRNK